MPAVSLNRFAISGHTNLSEGAVGVPPAAGNADPAAAAPVPPPRRTADRTGENNITNWIQKIKIFFTIQATNTGWGGKYLST